MTFNSVAGSGWKNHFFGMALIACLAFIVYSNTFDASFHFDDISSIVENYVIHRFDIREILTSSSRPVLDITFALNYYFGRLNVFGYHLVNLMLHIANGIMVYLAARLTIRRMNRAAEVKTASETRVPLYAGLLFVVHPVQTQAVTYIVSRSSVLATFFFLLSLLLFIRGYGEGTDHPKSGILFHAGAFVSACLAMGTKQEAATLPVVLLLYDYFFISNGNMKELLGHFRPHLAIFSSLGVVFYLSSSGMQQLVSFDYAQGIQMPQGDQITSFEYFLTQLHVIPYYIRLMFVPAGLNLDYDWPITRTLDLVTLGLFFLLLSLVGLGIWLFKRQRLISFGILWFFLTLSVTSSFIVLYDVIFEHRLYLPSVGFVLIMATLISRISEMKIFREKAL